MAEKKKKWAQDVDIKAGSLKALGWPNIGEVVGHATAANRGTIMSKLNYLSNVSADPATKAKANAAKKRIIAKLGPSGSTPKK